MDFATATRQLTFAKRTSFGGMFKDYIGCDIPPTLGDAEIALAYVVSTQQYTTNEEIIDCLPRACKDHFGKLQEMKTSRGLFFTRFVLFAKTDDDGLLVGFGTDDMYYAVAIWDHQACATWKPEYDLHRRPVLGDEETRTVICLSHHQEVTVRLMKYGEGHIALCPECNRLAYFD